MDAIDYSSKYRRETDQYQRDVNNLKKSHEQNLENINRAHENQQTNQKKTHGKQLTEMEKSYKENLSELREDQAKVLDKKNSTYKQALEKNKEQASIEKRENLKKWDRKFSDLKYEFDKNIDDTKSTNKNLRQQADQNYKESVSNIRKTARNDLDQYVKNAKTTIKETGDEYRKEKRQIISDHQKDIIELRQEEKAKRDFLLNNGVKEIDIARKRSEANFIENKKATEEKARNRFNMTNERIDKEIAQREKRANEVSVRENQMRNKEFESRFRHQEREYNKKLAEIDNKRKFDNLALTNVDEQFEDNFDNYKEQQAERKIASYKNDKINTENEYKERLKDARQEKSNALQSQTIENAKRMATQKMELTKASNKDKNKLKNEKINLLEQSRSTIEHERRSHTNAQILKDNETNQKIENLKENFNKSLKMTQEKSKQNLEMLQNDIKKEKKTLAKTLQNRNSEQNLQLKNFYNDKIKKISKGYEQKITQLELQNKSLLQTTADQINDIKVKTAQEVERQKKLFDQAKQTEINNERKLAQDREGALRDRIQQLQIDFAERMNEQQIRTNQKVRSIENQMNAKIGNTEDKYKDIIEQNNKYFNREVQRIKMSNNNERDRLITQYESKIKKLEEINRRRTEQMTDFHERMKTDQA